MLGKYNIGKISRFTAAFFVLFIIFSVGIYLFKLINLGLENGFDLLGVKIITYIIIGLYLIFGAYSLLRNIKKFFPITMLMTFLLLNFELGFAYMGSSPTFFGSLDIIILYLIPIVLIVISLIKEDKGTGEPIIKKWLESNNLSSNKAKTISGLYIVYGIAFILLSGGFLNIPLLKITSTDEFVIISQKAANLALNISILTISYFLAYFLIKVLFKEKGEISQ